MIQTVLRAWLIPSGGPTWQTTLDLADRAPIAKQPEATATPAFAANSEVSATVPVDPPPASPGFFPQYAREADDLIKPDIAEAVFPDQYAREAPVPPLPLGTKKTPSDLELPTLADYGGGIMPELVRDQVRSRWRAAELTQDDLARRVGISRPQLANALQGRFGLSVEAAARLRSVVATLPTVQAALL